MISCVVLKNWSKVVKELSMKNFNQLHLPNIQWTFTATIFAINTISCAFSFNVPLGLFSAFWTFTPWCPRKIFMIDGAIIDFFCTVDCLHLLKTSISKQIKAGLTAINSINALCFSCPCTKVFGIFANTRNGTWWPFRPFFQVSIFLKQNLNRFVHNFEIKKRNLNIKLWTCLNLQTIWLDVLPPSLLLATEIVHLLALGFLSILTVASILINFPKNLTSRFFIVNTIPSLLYPLVL